MNIGIDTRAANWYRGTGLGTYAYQLVNSLNLIDNNNSYTLVGDNKNIDFELNPNFKIKTVERTSNGSFWEGVKTPVELSSKDYNIYHIPQNGIGMPLSCPDTELVITLHDTIPLHMPETVSDEYMSLFNSLMPSIVKRSSGIITVSEYSKHDIVNDFGYPPERIYVTHLASENIYRPLDKSLCRNILKKYYSIENDFILYVGGFSPRKNIVGLIKAYNLVKSKLPRGMKLVIAGYKGKSYRIYKDLVDCLHLEDSVIFPGFIDVNHMPHLYNSATLLVYPSFYEGFGLPPIEAMACGTPVIASNLSSIPEILEDSALLFNPLDIESIGSYIITAVLDNNLRQSMIERGFKKNASLSWETTALETLNAYRSIAKME